MIDERYFTIDTKDLNFIGSASNKLTLTIDLSDEELVESHFGSYESIVLTRNGREYAFTSEEFINGLNRMARTAKRVSVPRESHVALGHYECGACGTIVGAHDRHCRHCGAELEGGW